MKVKILEYKVDRGPLIHVQSHNCHKGVWKVNPNFDRHQKVANEDGRYIANIVITWKKEYEKEMNTDKGYTPKTIKQKKKKVLSK